MKLIAVSTCRGAIRDAVLFLKGDINKDTIIEAFDLWFGASHIPFRHIKKDKMDRYIIQHGLGQKWSIYIGAVVNVMLNEVGHSLTNQKSQDQSISFDIIKQGNTLKIIKAQLKDEGIVISHNILQFLVVVVFVLSIMRLIFLS